MIHIPDDDDDTLFKPDQVQPPYEDGFYFLITGASPNSNIG